MALKLYAHPFSSYCQKALIALYENHTPFDHQSIDLGDPASAAQLEALWPFKTFPVLTDDDMTIPEASVIIEHLDLHHRGATRFLPDDPAAAVAVRFIDRVIDNNIHNQMQTIVGDSLRATGENDPRGVANARATLDTAYRWLDAHMKGCEWACHDVFSLADCSAAPALFYADWAHPIAEEFVSLRAYRTRLNARPSFARCIEEARPLRHLFPLGAPDRD